MSRARGPAAYLTAETRRIWAQAAARDSKGERGRASERCRAWAAWRLGVPLPPGAMFSTSHGPEGAFGEFRVHHPATSAGGWRDGRAETLGRVRLPWHALPCDGAVPLDDAVMLPLDIGCAA